MIAGMRAGRRSGRDAAAGCGRWVVPRGICALALLAAGPATASGQASLSEQLRSILNRKPHAQTRVAACVVDLASGTTIFELNADEVLIPASNAKVFVMAGALLELGADFAFETVVAVDGDRLVVIGDGDPGLGDERLHRARGEDIEAPFRRWAEALRRRGLVSFPQGLLIDASIFDDQYIHPEWEAEDLGKWYAAPVAGLNFNDNCLDITAVPAARAGDPVRVEVRPRNTLINLIVNAKSGGKGEPILRHPPGTMDYRIDGRCNKRWPFPPVAFPDPPLLTADALRVVLRGEGIAIGGEIRRGRVRLPDGRLPPGLAVIGTERTSLGECLSRIGKNSQNFFAECVLKRLGFERARRRGEPAPRGDWSGGAAAIVDALARMGVDTRGLVVSDGSGLSRKNQCTARQLTSVLKLMRGHADAQLFHASLSESGVDGSLRTRLRDLRSSVYAKTGTMRGIRTLSGYVDGADGPRFAFAVMFNGYSGGSAPYRELQDQVCRALSSAANTSSAR